MLSAHMSHWWRRARRHPLPGVSPCLGSSSSTKRTQDPTATPSCPPAKTGARRLQPPAALQWQLLRRAPCPRPQQPCAPPSRASRWTQSLFRRFCRPARTPGRQRQVPSAAFGLQSPAPGRLLWQRQRQLNPSSWRGARLKSHGRARSLERDNEDIWTRAAAWACGQWGACICPTIRYQDFADGVCTHARKAPRHVLFPMFSICCTAGRPQSGPRRLTRAGSRQRRCREVWLRAGRRLLRT